MKKVLFVCLGNICRSPMAEAIFNHMVEKSGLNQHIKSCSVGTSSYHLGERPDQRTIKICQEKGIKIHHFAQKLEQFHLKDFDIIIAMDRQNMKEIRKMVHVGFTGHLALMREYDEKVNTDPDVPDPYYGGLEQFREVYDILSRCCNSLLSSISEE